MIETTYHVTVETLERRRIAAMLAGDINTLDELLDPDLLFGHTDGHADDKETYLGKFRNGAVRYFDAEHQISTVRVIDDTALVSAHLKMRAELPSGSRNLNVVGLTVWVRRGDAWKMVAHHPTILNL